jgi:type IV pilus assembly protein PilX
LTERLKDMIVTPSHPSRFSHTRPGRRGGSRQRGISLVVVLLFLLAITGITVWAARYSMLGEGMARNQMDRETARQAAESALRDAERDIMNLMPTLLPNASCTRGRSRPPIPTDFTATCVQGLCIKPEAEYIATNWSTASATNKAVAEPWWPTGKGGSWNDEFDTKPGRSPSVTTTNCATFTGGVPLGTYTGIAPIRGVAVQPEYVIERFNKVSGLLKKPTEVYRITARGFGYTQRTQVVLQTMFVPMQED